jgi:aldehyde dehydrogenase (NAD+)
MADANIVRAVDDIVVHGFSCAGQWCIGTTRVIVDASIYTEFTDQLVKAIKEITVGRGDGDMGALASQVQLRSIEETVNKLVDEGAKILVGGKRPDGVDLARGNFYEPTVITDVGDYENICNQEIFGPVLVLVSAQSVDDALVKANTGHYGFSFSIYTADISLAEDFIAQVDAGLCHINLPTGFRDNALPLSAWKLSGRGIPECGRSARDFFTQSKAIYKDFGV